MRKYNRLISLVVAVTMVCMLSTTAMANENAPQQDTTEAPYSYTFPSGQVVEYYLDESLNPYNIISGKEVLLLIPLEHLKVKDPVLLAQIHANLPANPQVETNSGIIPFAVPTDYFDLSGSTTSYSKSVKFSGEEILETPIFKHNRTHRRLSFKTSSIRPITSNKINLIYTYYDIYYDKWDSIMFSAVNCNLGKDIEHTPSTLEYGKFTFNQYDDITSMTYKVSTYIA